MEAAQILQSNLLDVLFENRNKDYGAYELRQNYNKRLMIAIITTVLVLLSALFFLTFNKPEARYVYVPDNFPPIVIVRTIDEIKMPIELPKPTIWKQQIKTDRLVTPIILKDKLVTEDAITPIASIAAVDNTSHEGVIPDVLTNTTTTNIEPETLMPVPGKTEGEEPIENVEV
jgi:protein TonB